ncbi:MAG: hypothetical protein PGN07_08155 [Aeromicrobium erythreum]
MPGDPLRPGCDYERWARQVWGPDPRPTIYAHVATQPGVERIALQYFFYYPFNDFNNKHESDWERIQVEFPVATVEQALETTPDAVFYAQHYGAERAAWDDPKLEKDARTHPVVHVSAGSHASQFGEGLYLGRSSTEGFGCDTTLGPTREVRPDVLTVPSDPEQALEAYPWTGYRGHWGEVGPQRFYEGPTGPPMKQAWTKPFTWSEGARDTSFALPGAAVASSRAGQSFCDVVGAGSDAFRHFSSAPGPTLLVLLGLVLVLGWLVRRLDWAQARALPLVDRRPTGQVVASALRMLRAHGRIFLLVAAPAAGVSVVSSVLSAAVPTAAWWPLVPAASLLVLGLALAWGQVATAQAVADLDAGRTPTLGSLARSTRGRAGALGRTVALWAVVVGPLLLSGVLSPVALALVVAWSLVLPVAQLEGLSGWSALRRSWRLVRCQPLTVLVVLGLSALLVTSLGGLLAALVFIVSPAPFAVVSGVPQLVTTLVWPVTALLTTYAWANGVARTTTPQEGEASVVDAVR